jgi:hypothetical protein
VGSHVVTRCFRRPLLGRVVAVRPLDRVASVRLYDWCLLGRGASMVACHFSYGSLQVVDPPPEALPGGVADEKEESESSSPPSPPPSSAFVRKILDVQEHKGRGYQLYKARRWSGAHGEFRKTSSLIADLLVLPKKDAGSAATGQRGASVMIRGNLILTCIKCSNYMAVCKLWRNELAASLKHCMDSLYLLRSLEVKTSRRYRDYFGRYAGEIRVFGCWRIKSLQIMAHVFLEKRQFSAAKDLLRQAHKNATKHLSVRAGGSPEIERRLAQLSRSDRATMRLYSVVARQLAGHDAAREASRHWLLEDADDDDAQWPPLPIDEDRAEEGPDLWMTPTRDRTPAGGRSSGGGRRRGRRVAGAGSGAPSKPVDSPGTLATEAPSFDADDDEDASCASEQTSETAGAFFRGLAGRIAGGASPVSVKALVPSDANLHARDSKVFEARQNYLDTVVQKNNLSGTVVSFDDSSSRVLDFAPKGSGEGGGGGGAVDEGQGGKESSLLASEATAVVTATTSPPSPPEVPE